ncbi:MAG TPA: fumarylacetoacetate hydrolase family protein [Casimicrobiaceae bacterium]|nr:fumarylacetoacetate hydrolase family protein [Casimicrobiaceae bacterium]
MTTPERLDQIARHLADAWRSGRAWTVEQHDALTPEDSYAIQDRVARLLEWFPDGHPRAWKAGGNPTLTAAPLARVQASGTTWHLHGVGDIVAEAEISLRLARSPRDAQDVHACIGTMCASIEIVATRMKNGLKAPPAWKTADQQLHAGSVMGTEIPFAARDWKQQRGTLAINGEIKVSFEGTHPNGDPAYPLTWLVDHARARTGALRAGDAIMTGAWALVAANIGDLVEVEFENIGRVSVRLAG